MDGVAHIVHFVYKAIELHATVVDVYCQALISFSCHSCPVA